jgi:hypothetical protein
MKSMDFLLGTLGKQEEKEKVEEFRSRVAFFKSS